MVKPGDYIKVQLSDVEWFKGLVLKLILHHTTCLVLVAKSTNEYFYNPGLQVTCFINSNVLLIK